LGSNFFSPVKYKFLKICTARGVKICTTLDTGGEFSYVKTQNIDAMEGEAIEEDKY
jgi:hypothetical protein